jgi:hypothetical protein
MLVPGKGGDETRGGKKIFHNIENSAIKGDKEK